MTPTSCKKTRSNNVMTMTLSAPGARSTALLRHTPVLAPQQRGSHLPIETSSWQNRKAAVCSRHLKVHLHTLPVPTKSISPKPSLPGQRQWARDTRDQHACGLILFFFFQTLMINCILKLFFHFFFFQSDQTQTFHLIFFSPPP